jgi:replicative DNA helicase
LQAAESLSRNAKPEEVLELLRNATTARSHDARFDPGLSLGDVEHLLERLSAQEHDEFSTGIAELDRHHVVPMRKKLMVLLGAISAGKSWFLIQLGRRALWNNHRRVLHITLEMSQDEVQQRYWQSFMAIPAWQSDRETTCTRLRLDDNGRLTGFAQEPIEARCSIKDDATFPHQLRKYTKHMPGMWRNLIIKEFPTGGLSVGQLHGYLDGLEAAQNFVPDLLLLDYAGLLRVERDNFRLNLGHEVQELRGLAVERDIAVVTAQQVNRTGAKAARVEMSHVAEDISIPFTGDFILTLSRSDEEKAHKLARIWVDKNRPGAHDKFGAVLSQNYTHGQFRMESAPLERARYEQLIAGLGGAAAPQQPE